MRCLPLALLAIIGCGDGGHKPTPVAGNVTLDGKPLDGAHVRFIGDGFDPPLVQNPNGYTDAEGRYKLSYLGNGDGAPVGKYKVTITLHAKDSEGYRTGVNTLPSQYSKPEDSGFVVEVKPGIGEVPTLELKTRK